MIKIEDYWNNHVWLRVTIYILTITTVVVPFGICLAAQPIFCDSAFYLAIGERISDGYKLYSDVRCGYTPLWLYIEVAVKSIFHVPMGCYWPYLVVYDLFYFGVGFILYKMLMLFTANRSISLFCTWLFFPLAFWQQAYGILLEIPSVFFGLLSCYLVLIFQKKHYLHYLWIGVISCFSFLTKQYGAGFVALAIFLMLYKMNRPIKQMIALLVGYILPIIMCFCIWKSDFLCVLTNGYGTTSAVDAGRDISVLSKIGDIARNLWRYCGDACPALVAGLFCVPNSKKQGRLGYIMFAILAILGFSLQYYFNAERHYRIYFVPFSCLLVAEMLMTNTRTWLTWCKNLTIAWTVGASLFNTYSRLNFWGEDFPPSMLKAQAQQINQIVDKGDRLWVVQDVYYGFVFTTHTIVPNMSTLGYSFGALGLNPQAAMQQARDAEWVVFNPSIVKSHYYVTDSLKNYICQHASVLIDENDDVRLYHMTAPLNTPEQGL
ncbi:MAG: hypothetical protein KBS70_05540 [Bacteroidales bacterium]|nr:hypothetical protein [Candidatus Colicola equi]